MRHYVFALVTAFALGFAACSSSGGGSDPKSLAESVTKAVYNDDMAGVTANFSNGLAPQVTRASLGAVSDQMHRLGNLQGLTEAMSDLPSKRYTYDAKFDNGDMTVMMRLDQSGKIVAYRVSPGAPH
jgi:hypothetical protein